MLTFSFGYNFVRYKRRDNLWQGLTAIDSKSQILESVQNIIYLYTPCIQLCERWRHSEIYSLFTNLLDTISCVQQDTISLTYSSWDCLLHARGATDFLAEAMWDNIFRLGDGNRRICRCGNGLLSPIRYLMFQIDNVNESKEFLPRTPPLLS